MSLFSPTVLVTTVARTVITFVINILYLPLFLFVFSAVTWLQHLPTIPLTLGGCPQLEGWHYTQWGSTSVYWLQTAADWQKLSAGSHCQLTKEGWAGDMVTTDCLQRYTYSMSCISKEKEQTSKLTMTAWICLNAWCGQNKRDSKENWQDHQVFLEQIKNLKREG